MSSALEEFGELAGDAHVTWQQWARCAEHLAAELVEAKAGEGETSKPPERIWVWEEDGGRARGWCMYQAEVDSDGCHLAGRGFVRAYLTTADVLRGWRQTARATIDEGTIRLVDLYRHTIIE